MNPAERLKIFESNKRKYESKWGKWTLHKYLQKIPEIDNINIGEDLSLLRINT
jgi:hypothetical protein